MRSAIIGGITGGAVSYVSIAGLDRAGIVFAKAAVGCAASAAGGSSCGNGAIIAGVSSAAAQAFDKFVGPRPSLASGTNLTTVGLDCGKTGSNCYISDSLRDARIPEPYLTVNVIGKNAQLTGIGDFDKQSGPLSVFLNAIPGMNAVAQLHDTILSRVFTTETTLETWGTMSPAAGFTYTALNDTLPPVFRCRDCDDR